MAARKQSDGRGRVPAPQGHLAGIPYDWRRPTMARLKARGWNSHDRRLFTPKTFGWGFDINAYWLAHPGQYLRGRR